MQGGRAATHIASNLSDPNENKTGRDRRDLIAAVVEAAMAIPKGGFPLDDDTNIADYETGGVQVDGSRPICDDISEADVDAPLET